MQKKLKNFKETKPGHFYFQKMVRGKTSYIRLPSPDDPKFPVAYEKAKKTFDRIVRSEQGDAGSLHAIAGTFNALIEEYRSSAEFLELAKSTRRDYVRHLDDIESYWGDNPVKILRAKHVEKRRETMFDTPGKANVWLKVMRNLLDLAVRRDYCDANVARSLKMLKIGEHKPWPANVVQQALENADSEITALAIQTALYSGQRVSDCIRITHDMMEDDIMELEQKKRRSSGSSIVTVYIPVHPKWREAVAKVERRAETILYDRNGEPFTRTSAMQERINLLMKKLGHVDDRGKIIYTFHGLRKNSSNYLAEMGLTDQEIGAINGMSLDTVRHYTKGVRKRRLAENAKERMLGGDIMAGGRREKIHG